LGGNKRKGVHEGVSFRERVGERGGKERGREKGRVREGDSERER
jgi:hypothetical protein